MNYVKSCLIITMLLGVAYSQCNESNWQEYYKSEGHNMVGCYLQGAFLEGVNLSGANLAGANLSGAYFYLTNRTNTIWDECGITDENDDGYDDTSYDAGYVDGAESGDLNLDGANDVLDVATLVNNILNPKY